MANKERLHKVKHNSISEIRNAVNYLIEIFDNEGEDFEIRKLVVSKEGKLKVKYETKT